MHPRTTKSASSLAIKLQQYMTASQPRIYTATVVDVTNHLTLGYVLANANFGSVQVYGVPPGTVVTNMRIYIKGLGPEHLRQWTFVAYAPAAQVGFKSGSVMVTTGLGSTVPVTSNSNLTLPTTQSAGYFWSFFFYIPSLPAANCCLFDWKDSGTTKALRCIYTTKGLLQLQDANTASFHGYVDTGISISPHVVWHITWQLGPGGNWSALAINGYRTNASGTAYATQQAASTGDLPLPTTGPYVAAWLNSNDGTLPCPVGTWVSKMTWGTSANSTTPSNPLAQLPTTDAQIPNGRATVLQGLLTQSRLLCGSDAGTGTLHDTGAAATNFTVNTTYCTINSIGPY